MGFIFDVTDERGRRIGAVCLGHFERYYVLDAQTECPLNDQPAWCWYCGTVVEAEDLLSLAEIGSKLADLESGERNRQQDLARHPAGRVFPPSPIVPQIEEWSLLRRWRIARSAPPRCLRCGSTNIVPLDMERETAPHPSGHGTITFEPNCHTARPRDPELFTVDGERTDASAIG